MNYKYIQDQFLEFWKCCYGEQNISFYVPTDEHSSGFNLVEIYYFEEDNEFDVVSEDGYADLINFERLVKDFPKITLDKEYAFYGKFETWKNIELAFKGEKEIDLVRL